MTKILINKYIEGKTTANEERELKRLLLDATPSQLTKEERSILELLSFTGGDTEEEDIFAVDYTEEYNKMVQPKRIVRIWPWLVAACVAALLIVFLAPPREDATQMAKVDKQAFVKENTKDSVKIEKMQMPITEEKHIAQTVKRNATNTQPKQIASPKSHKKHSIFKSSTSNEFSELSASTVTEQDEVDEEMAFEDKIVAELHDDLQEQMQMCDIECFNNKLSRRGQALMASLHKN